MVKLFDPFNPSNKGQETELKPSFPCRGRERRVSVEYGKVTGVFSCDRISVLTMSGGDGKWTVGFFLRHGRFSVCRFFLVSDSTGVFTFERVILPTFVLYLTDVN